MIQLVNVEEAKKKYKDTFNKDVRDAMSVSIHPMENNIRIAAFDRFNNLRELKLETESNCTGYKSVCISSVNKQDVLWDFLFCKEGFWYETYKDTYRGSIKTVSDKGREGFISQIVFHTKKKEYIYTKVADNYVNKAILD